MHSLFQRSSLIAPSLFLFLSACDNSENLNWLPFLVHTQTRCFSTRTFHLWIILTKTWVWTTVLSRGDKPLTVCGLTLGILMEILVLSSGIRVDTTKEEFWLFPVFFSLYLSAKPHSYTSVSAEYSRLFFLAVANGMWRILLCLLSLWMRFRGRETRANWAIQN